MNIKSELLQFTYNELEILRRMDQNMKMFDVQWKSTVPRNVNLKVSVG